MKRTPAAISDRRSGMDMYGSCQRSAGITPRYASAEALIMRRIVGQSRSPHGWTGCSILDGHGLSIIDSTVPTAAMQARPVLDVHRSSPRHRSAAPTHMRPVCTRSSSNDRGRRRKVRDQRNGVRSVVRALGAGRCHRIIQETGVGCFDTRVGTVRDDLGRGSVEPAYP